MRALLFVAVTVSFLLGLGIYTVKVYSDTSAQMVERVRQAERAVARGNWDGAEEAIGDTRLDWDKHKNWWAVFIDHQEIDNINTTLARAEKYIECRERTLAAGELAVLKLLLLNIPEKERLQLKNVF